MELIELIRKAQQGDEECFTEICGRFKGLVKKYAHQPHLRPLGEEAEAQGWLAVVKAVKTYRVDTGIQPAGYIEGQVKYSLWNLFKKERRRWQHETALEAEAGEEGLTLLDTLPDHCDVAGSAELREISEVLRTALSELPERQFRAVVLTLVHGRRLADAAQEMGVSLQAVYNLQRRGTARLKKSLHSSLFIDIDG